MTNKQLKELKSLFRRLNEKNKCHDRKYVCMVEKYKYNGYAMSINFEILFSTDHETIMKWVFKNGLLCRIGPLSEDIAYMGIQ
jgi:hypothetical protein